MKVPELEGAQLDYWVARALGYDDIELDRDRQRVLVFKDIGDDSAYVRARDAWQFEPSKEWAQGGPIIERHMRADHKPGEFSDGLWLTREGIFKAQLAPDGYVAEGETPLIAAMRCIVASRFGEEVTS